MRGLAILAVILPATAQAETGALRWIVEQTSTPLQVQDIGEWHAAEARLIGMDALAFANPEDAAYFAIPTSPARFVVLNDAAEDRVSKAVLVFGDATPICGLDLATMPVDSGTGAFLTPTNTAALEALSARLETENSDLYTGFMEPQIDGAHGFAQFLNLPDGSQFPAFSTGWGDGLYPVAALIDASGAVVAIYADFMGQNDNGDWLLPPPCAGQS